MKNIFQLVSPGVRGLGQAAYGARRQALGTIGALVLCAAAQTAAAVGNLVGDPLSTPASQSLPAQAANSQMVGIAHAGKQLVAVGRRGVILRSLDAGQSWTQAPSPVSSDLTAVRFSDAEHGWIVGHDAVALKTSDGGASWQRMLDGRSVLKIIVDAYLAQSAAGDASVLPLLEDARRAAAQSATPGVLPYPLLDVWFSNSKEGFVTGAFGLLLRTVDGGASWTPWMERADNPRMVHWYAIEGVGSDVYLAGEQGLLRRLDGAGQRFVAVGSPYKGSYFGLHVQQDVLVVHGLRGNAYVSQDAGVQWHKVPTGVSTNIIAVLPGAGQQLLFVSQAGQVLASSDMGRSVTALPLPVTGEIYGATFGATGSIVTTGLAGVRSIRLPATRQ